jgi:cystathionine gamma-lyase
MTKKSKLLLTTITALTLTSQAFAGSENTAKLHYNTKLIMVGNEADESTGAVIPPIYMTSTYKQKSPGVTRGYEYTRSHNPTRTRLEKALASLENGKYALATSSGLAAETLVLHTLESGSTVLASDDTYGGTSRLFRKVFPQHKYIFTDFTNPDKVEEALKNNKVDLIWIETPTNPLLKIVDIAGTAQLAKKYGARFVVDNTFATPYAQNPLDLGADVVVHSMTKYINGHSDIVGGAIILNDKEFYDKLWFLQNATGPSQSPFDSWLVLRGIKTLSVRMDRHAENAMKVAQFLEGHPKVAKVLYPGLPSHPQHEIAKKQMRNFGGMITFFIKGDIKDARKFLEKLQVWTLAESLGGVESLVDHPAIMTHASVPPQVRKELGIDDTLIRLSVGIEDPDDLIADLQQALK